jgi:hypothetical protein
VETNKYAIGQCFLASSVQHGLMLSPDRHHKISVAVWPFIREVVRVAHALVANLRLTTHLFAIWSFAMDPEVFREQLPFWLQLV